MLKGYSREMALCALGQRHLPEDLLSDLLEWARMSIIHGTENKQRKFKEYPNQSELKPKSNGSTWSKTITITPRKEDVKKPTEPADESPCCWNCKKAEHLSRDCPNCRKATACFGCGVEGHIRPNCPDKAQISVMVEKYEQPEHPYCRRG